MGTAAAFTPTAIQRQALQVLKGGAKHILLFGGSRSGKTTILVMAIICRAVRYSGSRHLICRYRAKDARSSVLRETLLPGLNKTIGNKAYHYLAHESMVTLANGSEIWIGGLGDREHSWKGEVSPLAPALRASATPLSGGTPPPDCVKTPMLFLAKRGVQPGLHALITPPLQHLIK